MEKAQKHPYKNPDNMLVLGIESTCDETACAVVKDGEMILSNIIASQGDLHVAYGGVVPELACRRHIDICLPVLDQALQEAHVNLSQIDLIAVSKGPGLIGALLIGLNFAKGLAWGLNKPLIGVNHVEAHLYAARMNRTVPLPALGVVLSGGHTALLLIREWGRYELIGQTQDDAIGEAFDKAASLLDLPYPGGPQIETLSQTGDPWKFTFKVGQCKQRPFDFSFSGLKTALLYQVKGQNGIRKGPTLIQESEKADIAASFQRIAFDDILEKSMRAVTQFHCKSIVLGGGVTHNKTLRSLFEKRSEIPLFWPLPGLCMDNAAMIAGLGYDVFQKKKCSDPLTLDALPRISLCEA